MWHCRKERLPGTLLLAFVLTSPGRLGGNCCLKGRENGESAQVFSDPRNRTFGSAFRGREEMGAFVNLTPPEAILSESSCTFESEERDSFRRLDFALPSRKRCSLSVRVCRTNLRLDFSPHRCLHLHKHHLVFVLGWISRVFNPHCSTPEKDALTLLGPAHPFCLLSFYFCFRDPYPQLRHSLQRLPCIPEMKRTYW